MMSTPLKSATESLRSWIPASFQLGFQQMLGLLQKRCVLAGLMKLLLQSSDGCLAAADENRLISFEFPKGIKAC